MDVIEFLKRTDHRNLKNQINYLVKQKFKDREVELNERRQRLKQLLDEESQQLELELSILIKSRLEEKQEERLNWIGLKRLERQLADEELLKFTKMQQHLENTEELRHIYSREMLLASKQAQLYQIEEKKALREREARNERFWLEAVNKCAKEKEKREITEEKLRKSIANHDERSNVEQSAEKKSLARNMSAALREEHNKDNILAWNMDRKHKQDEDFYEWRKKVHYRNILERQTLENALNAEIRCEAEEAAAKTDSAAIQLSILKSLDNEGMQSTKNRHQQREYLEYIEQEKKFSQGLEKKFDDMLIGTGCVLEQKNKRPYGKNTR